ncbi:MFS transporter [Virgibacillus sp. LDC-1]|uniref:MFS transporter n=1 Tax=Virgibacillus sp. LDC-1 TaxID=3039856 RepID=UPI0024DE0CA6|nr:MFS transporter [Virgibacillus sp. LDC-1]
MTSSRLRFSILISLVTISGFSQGMLLPLIAIILEQSGVSSSVNGLHATGLYIGVLLASPFMEKPLQKYGFKPIILVGGLLVFLSLFLFPLWKSLWFWFILRLTIGIGDHMLHFGTQTWVTTTASKEKRGKYISLYGLFFALGFTLGPLMTRLLSINESLPFIVSGFISLFVWSFMFLIRNKWPDQDMDAATSSLSSWNRFSSTLKIAWVALLPAFGYGFLEATLHGIFPIYGLRIGHDFEIIAFIIPFFALGSIILQLPLGILSDRLGRRKVLLGVISGGIICFIVAALYEHSIPVLFITFALSGMLVGSLFSLGISYMTDILPKALLPAGNLLCGIFFSLGSILGPYISGIIIEWFPGLSFFYIIVIMLVILLGVIFVKREPTTSELAIN